MAELIDSYSESNSGYIPEMLAYYNSSYYMQSIGQSFTGNGYSLTSAKFYISRYGTLTGNCYAKLYAHSGTFGTSSVPTGTALATSDAVSASGLSTSISLVTFTFSTPYVLETGTKYVIALEFLGGDASNVIVIGGDTSSPTHDGNGAVKTYAGTWYDHVSYDAVATDYIFYVYGTPNFNVAPTMMLVF